MENYTLSVKLHTVWKIYTVRIINYTLCKFCNTCQKNSSHLKFFTLPPVVAVVTIIRYAKYLKLNTKVCTTKYLILNTKVCTTKYLILNTKV